MVSERWLQLKDLFQRAIELPPVERSVFIASHCQDKSLRAELEKLLEYHEQPSDFLKPPNEQVASSPSEGIDPVIGKCLHGYDVLRRIGAGGMGLVYEARQQHPSRLVAVKLLQPGCVTEQNVWRFENESETLSKLQHPGIAQVYSSGTFDFGNGPQPWFAMELVDGQPLHQFCKAHSLSLIEKLQLLLLICDAVQHAHEHGIIHRDLKPANILVEAKLSDAGQILKSATPKIIDFGLARMESQHRFESMHTATGDILGTLNYMSPERFSKDRSLIDARCDVYALGIIGYEMLAGRLPHNSRSTSVAEVIRSIEQDEPLLLGKLDFDLRGDIEVIFAKAIEKDLVRRYASVAQFSSDIRRFLNHQPILAKPASTSYRIRKFARRNQVLVGGVATTMLALVLGMVLVGREARKSHLEAAKSRYEADKATAINDFITNDFLMNLISTAHQRNATERLPVAELVTAATANIATMFAGKPLQEAAVRNEVGTIYYNLGEFERAETQYRTAMELWETALGSDHPDTTKAMNNLGQCYINLRRFDEAESFLKKALQARQQALGDDHAKTLETMNNLASVMQSTKRYEEAERMFRQTVAIQQRVVGKDDKATLTSMANLGSILASQRRFEEAIELHQSVYDACCRTLGEENLMTLHAGSRLGQTLLQTGQTEKARTLVVSVLESFERMHGPVHPDTIIERRLLARIYKSLGELAAAKNQLQLALDAALSRPEQFESIATKIRSELKAIDKLTTP